MASDCSRKLARRRGSRAASNQAPKSEGGTLPDTPTVLNTSTSMASKTPCSITLATGSSSSNMKFGKLSEELEKWVKDLLDSERDFVDMVAQLNATDRMVFQNISRFESLHQRINQLGESQADVCSDLSRIGGELLLVEEAVKNLENLAETKQSYQANKASDSCFDENLRRKLYNFMVQINTDLKFSTERLSDVIQAVNYPSSTATGTTTSPVDQIGCILNYHYECLVDIEDAYFKCKAALENIPKIQGQTMTTCLNDKY